MNTVKVRNIEIGSGVPKICVPIVGVTKDEIIAEAKTFDSIPVDVVEWRVDWFEGVFEFDKVEDVLKDLREALGETPILFTFRTSKEGGEKAIEAGVKLVSGSTGWMDKHGEEIKKLCTQGGKTLFWASNFSLGVTIFSAVNKYLAKIMNQFPAYDVTMSETHHIHKLDAPSGTAITLAEEILENIDRKDHWVKGTLQAPDGSVSGSAECAADEIPVSSIREGEVPGIHVIRYESEADSIILTHDAKNRKGFALGAVLAAEYTADKQGYLGMSDLFPFLK